jgi:hypothetical protein
MEGKGCRTGKTDLLRTVAKPGDFRPGLGRRMFSQVTVVWLSTENPEHIHTWARSVHGEPCARCWQSGGNGRVTLSELRTPSHPPEWRETGPLAHIAPRTNSRRTKDINVNNENTSFKKNCGCKCSGKLIWPWVRKEALSEVQKAWHAQKMMDPFLQPVRTSRYPKAPQRSRLRTRCWSRKIFVAHASTNASYRSGWKCYWRRE